MKRQLKMLAAVVSRGLSEGLAPRVIAEGLGAQAGLLARRCGTCSHFDRALGQERITSDPRLQAFSVFGTPADVIALTHDTDEVQPPVRRTQGWGSLGACTKFRALVPDSGHICAGATGIKRGWQESWTFAETPSDG